MHIGIYPIYRHLKYTYLYSYIHIYRYVHMTIYRYRHKCVCVYFAFLMIGILPEHKVKISWRVYQGVNQLESPPGLGFRKETVDRWEKGGRWSYRPLDGATSKYRETTSRLEWSCCAVMSC